MECFGESSPGSALCLPSSLPVIPYEKLQPLSFLGTGTYATVYKAVHSDWRTPVAFKRFVLQSAPGDRERKSLLKEAEVLQKARYTHIIQIFGICNEPEFLGIVTEYMSNGSLDQLLHEKEYYPVVPWPLRFRILYEIALGVNYLHNMNPPLLHHDLKTQNILLDSEYHVKIADFGLSKWRHLSMTAVSHKKVPDGGGTVIYMPPEEYEPSKKKRAVVKHDIYSYAIILWEILSRRRPFEEAVNPMQIMFSVMKGNRPDTSEESLPANIPFREVLVQLMSSGWAENPDERPPFLKCLLELEPVVQSFDEVVVFEAVLQVKRFKTSINRGTNVASSPERESGAELKTLNTPANPSSPYVCTDHQPYSSDEFNMSRPQTLIDNSQPQYNFIHPAATECRQNILNDFSSNSITHGSPQSFENNVSLLSSAKCCPEYGGIGYSSKAVSESETDGPSAAIAALSLTPGFLQESVHQGVCHQWIQSKREEIVNQMTEACLNQTLDALISRSLIMKEDYELITTKPTRASKVRQLLDNCDSQSEDFARIIVQKLKDNKQLGLQPYPDMSPLPSCVSVSGVFGQQSGTQMA
ncbi:receptor-interacting serine/threonine-protein kinase 2 [Protopterus annectens]|uniref:receptor-interacting serine/threonine-protein kinase 2 n=1 Tax=Protopterus annectens TaxID=7888 RepID=UPI001CF93832|nr:receptor-interacting serine/threonine-protein kinase 2 [Protopterus annectens]